jgi:hypothetical protein
MPLTKHQTATLSPLLNSLSQICLSLCRSAPLSLHNWRQGVALVAMVMMIGGRCECVGDNDGGSVAISSSMAVCVWLKELSSSLCGYCR